MRNYIDVKDLSAQIKACLQICHKVLNQGKHPEREYRLFNNLAESYLQKENIREYPKVTAIYQYAKKLVEEHLNGDKEKLTLIDKKIKAVELRFLEKVLKPDIKNREQEIADIGSYKEELTKFREEIKKELAIEDLGMEKDKDKDKEEFNEEGLKERAEYVERIYIRIREFFIGKRDDTGELTESGLINRLIENCIKQLGGLPKVGEDRHECAYVVFGIGSMALGTMTPWSDLEFGVLIEEKLSKEEEVKVKEYFKNLTSLLHIKVVNFGETPLRMMGIRELNNFMLQEESDKDHNWFYDDLTKPGLSFDGPHCHACKTALGRAVGYMKRKVAEGVEEIVSCNPYELIGTVEELHRFYQEEVWRNEDPHLVQALGHTVLFNGSPALLGKYQVELEKYRKIIETNSFKILIKDSKRFDPVEQMLDEDKEGLLLNVKKEIYRFPDRMVVNIGDCLRSKGRSNWEIIRSLGSVIGEQRAKDLELALSIATEMRLRTYANNNGQKEDLSAIARYESQIKEFRDTDLTEQIFYLKDIRLLYVYYKIAMLLGYQIKRINNQELLKEATKLLIDKIPIPIMGYIYKRFLKYYEAIKEFEILKDRNDLVKSELLGLYDIVGRYEEALRYKLEKLGENRKVYQGDHIKVAASLNDIGSTLERLGRHEEALSYMHESLKMRQRIYKPEQVDIAATKNNIGSVLYRLGKYEEALSYHSESLKIRQHIYKGDHTDIAASLNNKGLVLRNLGRYEEALSCHMQSLEMERRIYKGDHTGIASSLNNLGLVLRNLSRYEEALAYFRESLEMKKRIYENDHIDMAISLDNIGMILRDLGRYQEALLHHRESLEMGQHIYKGDHVAIASFLNNMGNILRELRIYEEALQYHLDGLEMRQRIHKGDHNDIVASFNLFWV